LKNLSMSFKEIPIIGEGSFKIESKIDGVEFNPWYWITDDTPIEQIEKAIEQIKENKRHN
jgi:hypothetical protein